MSVREKRNGKYHTMLEQGDVYPGSYQVGPTFNGPTSDAGLRIKHIEGKSTQAISRGYQLFDASKLPSGTANGVTFTNNGNGSFAVSGEPTSGNFTRAKLLTHDEVLMLFKAGVLRCATNNHEPYFYIKFVKGSTSTGSIGECNTKNRGSFTIRKEDLDDPVLTAEIGFYGASSNWNPPSNGLYKPMFYQDGTGEWEPFTGGKAGPQPEYPIPIESVEISKLSSDQGEETLTNPIVLRSLPDGTKDEYINGKIIRRVGVGIIDGTSSFTGYNMKTPGFYKLSVTSEKVSKMDVGEDNQIPNFFCNKLLPGKIADYITTTNNVDQTERICASKWSSFVMIVLKSTRFTNVESAASYLASNPITYYYKLKTPTIEPLSILILPSSAPFGSAQTDSPVDPVITWEALPAGSRALEVQELRKRIEELEKESVESA